MLPEQPEPPLIDVKDENEKPSGYISPGLAGESDEGDIDDDSEEAGPEEVEVTVRAFDASRVLMTLSGSFS